MAENENPQTAVEYLRRGWRYLATHKQAEAEQDFRQALTMNDKLVDAAYGLGMTLKALGQNDQAQEAFNGVLQLIQDGFVEDPARSDMMGRLARAHIKQIQNGS